jgi:hypothetical protein
MDQSGILPVSACLEQLQNAVSAISSLLRYARLEQFFVRSVLTDLKGQTLLAQCQSPWRNSAAS